MEWILGFVVRASKGAASKNNKNKISAQICLCFLRAARIEEARSWATSSLLASAVGERRGTQKLDYAAPIIMDSHPSPSSAVVVVFNPQQSRFQTSDGLAFLTYHMRPSSSGSSQGSLDLQHTYVPPSKRGLGVAGLLCKAAFDYAKEHNLRVIPTCSYVSDTFLPRNPEWKPLVGRSSHAAGL